MYKYKNNVGANLFARASKARQNKGITLIALVITIIVMLILVAVTITMAVNGGLFDYAGKATEETQNAIDAEQQLADGKVKIDGVWYDSIDDYVAGIQSDDQKGIILDETLNLFIEDGYNVETSTPVTGQLTATLNEVEGTVTWSSDNEEIAKVEGNGTTATITAVVIGTANITASCSFEGTTYTKTCKVTINTIPELKVGDYVNYTPTSGTYTVASGTNGTGYSSNQSFSTEDLDWRILSIDETTGELLLVSAEPTSARIYIDECAGYNHAVDILNDFCEELYSNENGTTARSINVEDINAKTTYDFTQYKGMYSNYNDTKQLSTYGTSYMYYPKIYSQEIGFGSANTFNTTGLNESQGLEDGVTDANGVTTYSTATGEINGRTAGTDPYTTSTYYEYEPENYLRTDLGKNNSPAGLLFTGKRYWVASRCVQNDCYSAAFFLRWVTEYGYLKAQQMVNSNTASEASVQYGFVRPVVSLGTNAKLSFVSIDSNSTAVVWDLELK